VPRRARRARDQDHVYRSLTDGEHAVFETMKDAFVVAACLGYEMGNRKPLESSGGQIPWSVFREQDRSILELIALAETEDMTILGDAAFDERLTIAEEYANAGIEVLERKLLQDPGNSLTEFINMIRGRVERIDRDEDVISQFADDLFDEDGS